MKPITEEITTVAGKAALSAVADEIREARQVEEGRVPLRFPLRGDRGLRFQDRRGRARAVMSEGMNKARETWIGTRWYARSHRSLMTSLAVGAAVVAIASVAAALSRRDD